MLLTDPRGSATPRAVAHLAGLLPDAGGYSCSKATLIIEATPVIIRAIWLAYSSVIASIDGA
jgi:hypothetical protein